MLLFWTYHCRVVLELLSKFNKALLTMLVKPTELHVTTLIMPPYKMYKFRELQTLFQSKQHQEYTR